jgi:hypothetical protein
MRGTIYIPLLNRGRMVKFTRIQDITQKSRMKEEGK